ncbi:MAG TPA: TetR/AcrR family transcriptional regulator [Bacteroidia bacterium]|nr:TetR/AcrR family transcriptional regulator [Bacteroidia bacterium]
MNEVSTKERIMQAAHELFYQYGIRSITMDDIAKHLSISKKTIYQFFEEKDEIVGVCCNSDLSDHAARMEDITENSKDAVHEIIECMKYLGEMFSSMNPNLFYDLQKFHPSSWNAFRNFKEQKLMQMVETNLKRGIREELYRADINIKVLAKLRIEEVELGMNPLVFPPGKFNLKEVQLAILDHFIHGITTLKGHKLINKYKKIKEEE